MPQELHISSGFTIFSSRHEVPDNMQELLDAALKACDQAYAPYSGFQVGAALRDSHGSIHIGNNQENAAYPSGLCAERVAIFAASANQPGLIVDQMVVVANQRDNLVPAPPCGACRQVLLEYEVQQEQSINVLFSHDDGQFVSSKCVSDLLPFTFTAKNLNG